ncbi:MAG: hypothetical protein FWE67_09825 [Planctomycetaceae bacterium]|nr:hypothetical protein [Planctomycetaceae bacterium]
MAILKKKKKGADDTAVPSDASPFGEPAEEKPAKKKKSAEKKSSGPKIVARPDFYTLLLGLSVAAMIIAVVLLYMHLDAL